MSTKVTRTIAVVMSVLMMTAVAVPAVAAAGSDTTELELSVTQQKDTGNVTVTLSDNGSVVSNATFVVSGEEYAGNGTYPDQGGTLNLTAPSETVNVTINATTDNGSIEKDVTLIPRADSLDVGVTQSDNGNVTVKVTQYDDPVENASVNVTANESYADVGNYTTDADGIVSLSAPDLPVAIDVNASYEGLEAWTSADLDGQSLAVAVEQHEDRTATVTVTRGETTIENATVEVSSSAAYEGNGTYETDENGTVPLPAPEDTVNVTVTASVDDLTATEHATLFADELAIDVWQDNASEVYIDVTYGGEPAAGAEVNVTGDYEDAGDYTTNENGTVSLQAPTNDTTIDVLVSYKNDTAEGTYDIIAENDSDGNNDFAKSLVAFIDSLKSDGVEGPLGLRIAAFVHKNNPASADDNAGPPEHAGPKGTANNQSVDNVTAKNQGPPEHAGPENKTAEGNGNGHGNGNGNGNGNGHGPNK